MMYVGKIAGGRDVRISKKAPNQHLIVTGISGSGKSVRIADIERHIIEEGGTVIALDVNGTHEAVDSIFCHYISAQEDGLNIRVLDRTLVENGQEILANLIEYVKETICPRELRGACQVASVRRAIEFAFQYRNRFSTDMEAIAYGLKEQDNTASLGAYNHLYPILEGNIFRNSEKRILEEKINIVSLKGLSPKTQNRVIEIMLRVLWRQMRIQGYVNRRFTIVLDEVQNLNFYPGSILFQLLTEVRKYGVNLILATQTLNIFTKKELAVIEQAATKLFFQQSPADVKKIADLIETGHKEKWISTLSHLHIGQAITVGELEIGGRYLQQPIITNSVYQKTCQEVRGYEKNNKQQVYREQYLCSQRGTSRVIGLWTGNSR